MQGVSKQEVPTKGPEKVEEKLVAHLDILGFKDLVGFEEGEEHVLDIAGKIQNAMIEAESFSSVEYLKIDVNTFSDSISIIADIKRPEKDIQAFISKIAFIQGSLLSNGFLVRGGVSKGLFHSVGNTIVSPAYMRAYRLESEIALHPRVLLDDIYSEEFIAWTPDRLPTGKLSDRMGYYHADLLAKQPGDTNWYCDFLTSFLLVHAMGVDESLNIGFGLQQMQDSILKGLTAAKSPHVLMKYLWLTGYFESYKARVKNREFKVMKDVSVYPKHRQNQYVKMINKLPTLPTIPANRSL